MKKIEVKFYKKIQKNCDWIGFWKKIKYLPSFSFFQNGS